MDFVMDAPGVYFEVPWHQQPRLHMRLVVVLSLVLLTAVLGWPVGAWLRRRWGVEGQVAARLPRWVAGGAAFFFLFLIVVFASSAMDITGWMLGVPGPVKIGLLLTYPAILLSLGAVYFCVMAWRKSRWRLFSRIHYTFVTTGLVVMIWFLNNWNLIGWRF
jgi:hypothetical protein